MEPHYGRDRRVTGMPGSHPAPRECLCSALGTSRSWGRAERDYSSSFLLLLLPLAGGGGVPAQQGTPALAPALGSGAGLKGHIQIRDCLRPVPGQGPGQLLGYLGCWAGCRHGCPQPSPLLHQERCPGTGTAQPGCWAASPGTNGAFFLFSAHDLPFLLGRSQVRDIQESPWDEFPSEEAVSPSPPAGLASRPARHTEGHPLPLDTSWQVQLGANLPSCSWVLVIQA